MYYGSMAVPRPRMVFIFLVPRFTVMLRWSKRLFQLRVKDVSVV